MDVRWSPRAMRDANRIFIYIANENHYAAQAVFRAMHDTALSLAQHPWRHRNRGGGYRRIPVAHYDYCILYRIRHADDGPYVSIESVRHVARR
ncbi:type II toxin-antitoxin system RelE/ParE family toxin [Azospirillum sp.]|uniref:type II toxin-antitoxin system RelE/ParE family toxin n=1 Tax=Azospirillum sp. TaxID=34012 RepID=UPI002D2F4A7C|nr:type II toxin-antitoxin system RelE/ParE family toxin [Azospirillum sp.]HYD66715.1 type II toxin-antitoxin system RelE/ParE family toxin [Azospirillum sp.]